MGAPCTFMVPLCQKANIFHPFLVTTHHCFAVCIYKIVAYSILNRFISTYHRLLVNKQAMLYATVCCTHLPKDFYIKTGLAAVASLKVQVVSAMRPSSP